MSWVVAVAEHARQDQALSALSKTDFVAYLPKFSARIIRCGRQVVIRRPLFGRYFFVFMNDMWKSLYSIRGISRVIIGPEELPILVKDHVIDQIKVREECEISSRFFRGELVIPNKGHLAGVAGKFDKTTQRDREIALFDILGSEVPVEFAPGILFSGEQEKPRTKRGGRRHNRSMLVAR